MSKVAHYLQEHLIGEVMTGTDARRYFATDGSILQTAPLLVAYPRNENDVRKIARFTWQLAERGRIIPMTARGSGTDQTGAAIGSGIIVVFPAHMHRIIELDTKSNTVTIEPGIIYGKLQQTLLTHNRCLPAYPASMEYSTMGGAIANNSTGEQSLKYGDTRGYIRHLRVVLANGEVIETGHITKRELNKKLGLATFEGEIYRSLDTLLEENKDLVEASKRNVARNNSGYYLHDVRKSDGSFDLSPLFAGSQGTLGIVTEAVLNTEPHTPTTTLMMATFDDFQSIQAAILELKSMSSGPSSIEFVDGELLNQVQDLNPNHLQSIFSGKMPAAVLLTEFDHGNDRLQKKSTNKASKIFEKLATSLRTETTIEGKQLLWKVRQSSGIVMSHNEGQLKALPIIDDASVPLDKLQAYLEGLYALLRQENMPTAIWGHIGEGNLHLQPRLNIGQVGDRQKAFRLMDEYYKLVIGLGGSISSERNDGRLRAPYVAQQYGDEVYGLFQKVKQIFDPYGTLNPGVKLGTTIANLKAIVRPDYSLDHFYDHLPRT